VRHDPNHQVCRQPPKQVADEAIQRPWDSFGARSTPRWKLRDAYRKLGGSWNAVRHHTTEFGIMSCSLHGAPPTDAPGKSCPDQRAMVKVDCAKSRIELGSRRLSLTELLHDGYHGVSSRRPHRQ